MASAKLNRVELQACSPTCSSGWSRGPDQGQELESLLAWAWQADCRGLPYRPEHHDGQTTLVVQTGSDTGIS